MGKNFYISDTHFGHQNIIKLDNRPFKNCDQMENVLVMNWNNNVTSEDTVYILGDFCWLDGQEWDRILNRLNGHKILIKGNHDVKRINQINSSSKTKHFLNGFDAIYDYLEVPDNGRRVILSHYPILFYRSNYNGNIYHLFGHVHITLENDLINDIKQYIIEKDTRESGKNLCQFYNVGCMLTYMGYTPRTLDEILACNRGVD